MSIQNLVVNGSFENGALPPWVGQNATVTTQFSHSGFWSARLLGSNPSPASTGTNCAIKEVTAPPSNLADQKPE